MIGQTLRHYRILSQIGSGGMGAVYRAEDLKLHREVALKLLPLELGGNSERFERFQREARSVAALSHPNIVTLFSVEEDAGRHFITMELVKGQAMNATIPKGGYGIKDFFNLAIPLADALATAHEKGITHRDLKPANVMIDSSGRVKVIDFGLAKATAAGLSSSHAEAPTVIATMEGRIMGTPAYMSPEQVEGRPVDHRADIFALGILFHEMLSGERPFKGDSHVSVMSAILKEEPPSVSGVRSEVPLEISRLIRRCLQKAAIDRSQSALEVRNELKELESQFVSGTLTSISQNKDKPKTQISSSLVKVAAAAALLAGILGIWKVMPQREEEAVGFAPLKVPGAAPRAPAGIPRITRLSTTDRLEAMPTWSPDGKHIAFVSTVGNFKQIFTREAGSSVARQLTHGQYDHIHPAWGPDTNTMFYSRSAKEGIGIGLGDSNGGSYMLGSANIVRHNLGTGDTSLVVDEAAYPTVAPGGRDLFFIHKSRVYKSDLNGGRVVQLSEDESDAMTHTEPKVFVDGSKVVFRRYNISERVHHIAIVTTSHQITLVRTNGYNLYPTWHPSGGYVYFSNYGGSGMNIWRLPVKKNNTAVGGPEPVTVGGGEDLEPAFSPDGGRMLFSISSQNADIYRVSIDPATGKTNGPPAEPMPFNSNREDSRASWAPSAEQPMVVFNSDREGDMNLYIWREKDNSVTKVTSGPGGDFQATWSPDLQQLVFFSSRHGNAEVYVVSTNANSQPVRLTHSRGLDYNPFFSTDGKQIVFASEREGKHEVYVMNADGSQQRRVVKDANFGHFIQWYDKDSLFNIVRVEGERAYYRIYVADGRLEKANTLSPVPAMGGHGSFSPDRKHFMDLDWPHARIWVISTTSNEGKVVYQKSHSAATIDYPWWSPDGRWATFDFTLPRNSELFLAEWEASKSR